MLLPPLKYACEMPTFERHSIPVYSLKQAEICSNICPHANNARLGGAALASFSEFVAI